MKKILLLAFVAAVSLVVAQTNITENTGRPALSDADRTFQALETEWATAVKQRDADKLIRLEADEFEFTDPGGRVWPRLRQVETIRSGDLQIDSFELSGLKARVYGDTAVARFRIVWAGRFRDAEISGPQQVTDVWVKRDGRWQMTASHSSRIAVP